MQGVVMGTVAYMAPEQARGEAVDHRADLWSVGLVLYEMAKGTRPAPAVRLRVEASPELERIVSKCLETDPALRYQHAADLRTDLERLRRGSDSALTGREQPPATARARWPVVAAAAAAGRPGCGGLRLLSATGVGVDRQGHDRARRVHQHDRRSGVRRYAATRTGGAAAAVAVPQPHLRGAHPKNAAVDEPAGGRAIDSRPGAGRVRAGRAAPPSWKDRSRRSAVSTSSACARSTAPPGDILADEQAQAARKEEVLSALSQMATRFRTRVGESLATIEKHSRPLAEATTPSLDALQAYSAAVKEFARARRLALLQRAVALDPEFAVAHAQLGFNLGGRGEAALGRQSLIKAYQLRHRASDVERFSIETFYDRDVTGNLEREQRTLETWAQSYPRDPSPHTLLAGLALTSTGQHELAIAETEKAIALDPDWTPAYGNRAFNQLYLNRLDDALLTITRARERKLERGRVCCWFPISSPS